MSHPIPFEALDGKIGVLGITGSGKTFTAIGLVEQLLEQGRQVIIIDPTGAYHGLRTAFPVIIFGGLYGDIPIAEADGEMIARVIVERNLSAIVDVSLLLKESHGAARRFMGGFVAALKNSPARARYVVMDEADEFMPENVGGGDARLFGDLKWIVRRGRIDGWRMLMVTQRPQDIAKSVLTQCETLVIHKLTAPQDRKAIEEWVKGNADAGQAKEVLGSLARLETGEAWIWSPRHDLLVRAKLPANRSADTSRTPDAEDEAQALAKLAPAEIAEIRAALAQPRDIVTAPGSTGKSASAAELAELAALRTERNDWVIERAVGQQQIDALAEENRALHQLAGQIGALALDIARIRPALDRINEIPAQGGGGPEVDEGQTEGRQVMTSAAPRVQAPAPAARTATEKAGGGNASPAALAIADLLDRINPAKVTWSQAATMTGRKASGGNFNTARRWLRESGRMVEDGEFIRSSADAPAGLTRFEAVDLWKSVLTNPAPRMIDALAISPLHPEELAERLGVQPRGGNWNNGLSQLRRNGIAELRGGEWHLASPLPGEHA